jgi:hypothetical protein
MKVGPNNNMFSKKMRTLIKKGLIKLFNHQIRMKKIILLKSYLKKFKHFKLQI